MKTRYFTAIATLMFIGNVTVSCNSCEDKNNDPIPTQTPEVNADGTANADGMSEDGNLNGSANGVNGAANSQNGGANSTNDNYGNEGPTAGSPSNLGTAVNRSRDVSKSTTKSKTTKSGYSAPNGTDAENHDGDPYTKHDTTAMPSGTSIR